MKLTLALSCLTLPLLALAPVLGQASEPSEPEGVVVPRGQAHELAPGIFCEYEALQSKVLADPETDEPVSVVFVGLRVFGEAGEALHSRSLEYVDPGGAEPLRLGTSPIHPGIVLGPAAEDREPLTVGFRAAPAAGKTWAESFELRCWVAE